MTDTTPETLKTRAKRLRAALSDRRGLAVGHGQALELVTREMGFRDWNTLSAAADTAKVALTVGDRVRGFYSTRPFSGEALAVEATAGSTVRRTDIRFDEPVDASTSPLMSIPRRRVAVLLDEDGHSCLINGLRTRLMQVRRA